MVFFNEKKEVKEPFCGACAVGLGAAVGAGVTGGSTKIQDKKTKNIVFWLGVGFTLISILILIYLLCFKKCKSCR